MNKTRWIIIKDTLRRILLYSAFAVGVALLGFLFGKVAFGDKVEGSDWLITKCPVEDAWVYNEYGDYTFVVEGQISEFHNYLENSLTVEEFNSSIDLINETLPPEEVLPHMDLTQCPPAQILLTDYENEYVINVKPGFFDDSENYLNRAEHDALFLE